MLWREEMGSHCGKNGDVMGKNGGIWIPGKMVVPEEISTPRSKSHLCLGKCVDCRELFDASVAQRRWDRQMSVVPPVKDVGHIGLSHDEA